MEPHQDVTPGRHADFGVGVDRAEQSFRGVSPVRTASVHHNVDLPFKVLAPFVPAEHWAALEKKSEKTLRDRVAKLARDLAGIRASVLPMLSRDEW